MTCANCTDCNFDQSKLIPKDIHEIHVTVETTAIDRFEDACSILKIKPIVIDLNYTSQVMTSSTFRGSNVKAIRELWRICDYLTDSGFKVVRKKIECSPTNDVVPSKNGNPHYFVDGYFECHFAISNVMDKCDMDMLDEACTDHDLHRSRNRMKTADGTVQMLTYRRSNTIVETFTSEVDKIHKALDTEWAVDKVIIEYAWYDSNIMLDKNWINSEGA